jgi:hypothetical protein
MRGRSWDYAFLINPLRDVVSLMPLFGNCSLSIPHKLSTFPDGLKISQTKLLSSPKNARQGASPTIPIRKTRSEGARVQSFRSPLKICVTISGFSCGSCSVSIPTSSMTEFTTVVKKETAWGREQFLVDSSPRAILCCSERA